MQVLMIFLCLVWGFTMGIVCRNIFLAVVLCVAGGYAIGQIFQSTGLLG